jgi:hypothetical protein
VRWSLAWLLAGLAACSSDERPQRDAPTAPLIDAPPDHCAACRSDQLCVERYTGTCQLSVACVTPTVDCPNNTCSSACEAAYCGSPYQCQNRAPCGGESPVAFTCYGP